MTDRMILIMVDECGDEIEVERFNIGDELDDDYLQLWKEMKIEKYRSEYPEARGFYFEDRRNMNRVVNQMIREDDGWYDDEDEDYDDSDGWKDDSDIGCSDCPDSECNGHCMSCAYRNY